MATGIDLSDYTLIDQELNTGNKIKDYRLDLLFKKDNTIVNLEINYEVTKWTRRKQYNYLFRLAESGYDIVGNYKEGLILMSELEKLKLNDEFNAYYDYEAVIRKEKNSEYASGRDDGLAEGRSLGLAEGPIEKNWL